MELEPVVRVINEEFGDFTKSDLKSFLYKYRKFTLDTPGVKGINHDFSHEGNMRDIPLENYIHKLKFTKLTGDIIQNTFMGKNHDLSI